MVNQNKKSNMGSGELPLQFVEECRDPQHLFSFIDLEKDVAPMFGALGLYLLGN